MHPSVVRLSQGLLVFLWLCASSEALPLYASQKSLSLVLCTDLDSAVSSLREQPLSAHEVGADWLEQDCVAIDPCRETGAGGSPTLRGTWLHSSPLCACSSSLGLFGLGLFGLWPHMALASHGSGLTWLWRLTTCA